MTENTLKIIFKSYINTTGKYNFVYVIFVGCITGLVTVLEPLFFAEIIKYLEVFYNTGDFSLNDFINIIIIWGVFIVFTLIVNFYYRNNLVSKSCILNYTNNIKVFGDKVLKMSYGEYLGKKHGSIYKILDKGCEAQFQFLFFFLTEVIKSKFGILSIIIILFYINWLMALLVLSMLPLMLIAGYYFFMHLYPTQKIINDRWSSVFSNIGDFMSNFLLVKTLCIEKKIINKINHDLDHIYKYQMSIEKGWSISDVYTGILVMVSRILVLGFGTYFVIKGTLSLTVLFLFFSYIGWVYFPLGFLFGKLRNLQEDISWIEKMNKNLGNLDSDLLSNDGIKNEIIGNIEFKKVSFEYLDNIKVLNNISFLINKGEKIALVGNTGAGKSTIISLLFRLWKIKSGEILIDGEKIENISINHLRNNIGLVAQDNTLFNTTIKENLRYANSKATKKDIIIALKNAKADFVFDLKEGIDTIIGERGLKLSGGEKQRLSIARLFLKNPKILILDEATSALDNKTEKLVHVALENLMKGRTSIIIAHRLSTIQNVDKIFVIQNGKIIESGNYKDLIDKKGYFYSLATPDKLLIN